MKLRKLNDLILEADAPNPHKINTIEYALHERYRQLFAAETIDSLLELTRWIKEDIVVYGLSHET